MDFVKINKKKVFIDNGNLYLEHFNIKKKLCIKMANSRLF